MLKFTIYNLGEKKISTKLQRLIIKENEHCLSQLDVKQSSYNNNTLKH